MIGAVHLPHFASLYDHIELDLPPHTPQPRLSPNMASLSAQPSVRLATIEDVPSILSMIRELADYEHALDRVEASVESLSATLTFAPSASNSSPDKKWASCFLLTLPAISTAASTAPMPDPAATVAAEEICGMALYFTNYSTWTSQPGIYLEDLFVRPAYRRRGYASLLFQSLAKECHRISGGRGRLEWSCLRWNESALGFYRKLGATTMDEWVGLRVEGPEGLRKLSEVTGGR